MSNKKNIDPTVSVVMITYNHEQFIREAIEGVLMQKVRFPVELIIADDCSPDNTEEIVKNIQENYKKGYWVKYTKHKNNKGMMPNFIWALNQAEGKYIALCEGDDYWTDSNKLKKQVSFLEEHEACSFCFHRTYEKYGGSFSKDNLNEGKIVKFYLDDILNKNYAHTPSIIFRRSQLFPIPEFFKNAMPGDHTLQCLLLRNGGYANFSEDCMAVYRKHDGGIWSSHGGSKFYLEKSKSYLVLYNYLKVKNKSLVNQYLYQIADHVASKGYKKISRIEYLRVLSLHFNKLDYFRRKNLYIVLPVFVNRIKKLLKNNV